MIVPTFDGRRAFECTRLAYILLSRKQLHAARGDYERAMVDPSVFADFAKLWVTEKDKPAHRMELEAYRSKIDPSHNATSIG